MTHSSVALILKDWTRTTKPSVDIRKPITYSVLKRLKRCVRSELLLGTQDKFMLWSFFTLAYFGFLRVSEYTTELNKLCSCTSMKSRASLLFFDVALVSDYMLLTIRKDKTNQDGIPICLKLMPTHKTVVQFEPSLIISVNVVTLILIRHVLFFEMRNVFRDKMLISG